MADARDNQQEAQRKIHETESNRIEETKERTRDLRPDAREKEKEDEDAHGQENPQEQRPITIGSISSSDKSKGLSGGGGDADGGGGESYPERVNEPDCIYYLRTGACGFGSRCRFNHPRDRMPIGTPICKYFLRRTCTFGSACLFQHKECLPRITDSVPKTESESYRPEKKAKTIPDSGEIFEDLQNRSVDPQENKQEQIERQRREAQDNLQEMPENQNVDDGDQQNPQEQRLMEMPENQQNPEEQRQRDIESQRREARLRLDQMKPTVKFNDLSGMRESLQDLGIERKEGDGF